MQTTIALRAPVQVAYHVADPEKAAVDFAQRFGWGPFSSWNTSLWLPVSTVGSLQCLTTPVPTGRLAP